VRFEFESGIVLFCFSFTFVSSGESRCLSRGVQVIGVAWYAVMKTVAGVGDLVQRTRDSHTCWILGDRAVERSGGAMCDLHLARGD
jgi:hypothetical protein